MKSIIDTQGARATTFEETLRAADLNWEPLEDGIKGIETGVEMPRMKILYRSDTKQPLGVVGEGYEPSNPATFLKQQYELAQSLGGSVTRAGFTSFPKARAFSFVKLEDWTLPKSLIKKGDVMSIYLYSTDGWSGDAIKSRLYIERLACLNGAVSRQVAGDFWNSHAKGMAERNPLRVEEYKKSIKATTDVMKDQFVRLLGTKMTPLEMEAFLENLLPGESTRTENRRKELLALFFKPETGNLGQTRWDAYNAVTEYVTHVRSSREGEHTVVEASRFFNVTEKDTLRSEAMKLLLN
jgi:hypothetical protein